MHCILERLGVDYHDEDKMPEVVVFVISGPTLAIPTEQVVAGFSEMLSDKLDSTDVDRWSAELSRLIQQESKAFRPPGKRSAKQ